MGEEVVIGMQEWIMVRKSKGFTIYQDNFL